jgi:hypothetical protein
MLLDPWYPHPEYPGTGHLAIPQVDPSAKPATDVALTSIRSWSAWEWTWHHVLGGLVCWFPLRYPNPSPIRFSYFSGLLGTYKISVSYELISVSFIYGEG